jgi:hypothetical protein
MLRSMPSVLFGVLSVFLTGAASAQQKQYALTAVEGLTLHGVTAQAATHKGRQGVRLVVDTGHVRQQSAAGQTETETIAKVEGIDFTNGVIEVELAGSPGPGAAEGARGFVGIAFRLQPDMRTYDAFYLRPTNGRAEDPVRRGRAAQYISHPGSPWYKLRSETPGKYEAAADILPDEWTKVRIEVQGERARLFVNDQPQPTLVVNDVKSGASRSGGIALWIGPGSVAHFRNLSVRRAP